MIKRPPEPGEGSISHYTVETGDRQDFALCEENYMPEALAAVVTMREQNLGGFRLKVWPGDRIVFSVMELLQGGAERMLTTNDVSVECLNPLRIELRTSVMGIMGEELAAMIADLEQCAAIALVTNGEN